MKPADDVKQSTPELAESCKSICYLALRWRRYTIECHNFNLRRRKGRTNTTLTPILVLISYRLVT